MHIREQQQQIRLDKFPHKGIQMLRCSNPAEKKIHYLAVVPDLLVLF